MIGNAPPGKDLLLYPIHRAMPKAAFVQKLKDVFK